MGGLDRAHRSTNYFTSSDPHRDIYAIHTAFYSMCEICEDTSPQSFFTFLLSVRCLW